MTGRKYSLLAKFEFARRWSATDHSRFSISPKCSMRSRPFVFVRYPSLLGDILPHEFTQHLRCRSILIPACFKELFA